VRFIFSIFLLVLLSCLSSLPAHAELSEKVRQHLDTMVYEYGILEDVHKALTGSQLTYRSYAATYLGKYGTYKSVPLLIEALSDESVHIGANYQDAGMATTRHRASLALQELTGENFGFQWDAPPEERKAAIGKWRDWLAERDEIISLIRSYMSEQGLQNYDLYRVHMNNKKDQWGASLTEDPPSPGAPALSVDRKTHEITMIKGR